MRSLDDIILIVDGEEENNPKALEVLSREDISFLFTPCWKTMVKVPEEIIEDAIKLAESLREMDRTFRCKIIPSRLRDVRMQRCKLLVIYSPTKDQAYKRGSYFVHNLNLKKYERLQKGYYWVKEYSSNLHSVDLQGKIHGPDDIIKKVKEALR